MAWCAGNTAVPSAGGRRADVGEDGVADIRDIPVSLPSLAKPDNTPLAPCDLPTTSQLIADWLSDLADRIGAPEMPLFQAHDRRMAGNRLTTRSMSRIILNHLIASGHVACEVGKPGTPGRVRQPRQLSAHGIRRSSARRIVEKYGLEVARELLQHASVETTRRAYARIKQDTDLRRAAEDLGS